MQKITQYESLKDLIDSYRAATGKSVPVIKEITSFETLSRFGLDTRSYLLEGFGFVITPRRK